MKYLIEVEDKTFRQLKYQFKVFFVMILLVINALNVEGTCSSDWNRVVSVAADGAYSVFAIDIDGDGDIDLASASWNDDTIAWYEMTYGCFPSVSPTPSPTPGPTMSPCPAGYYSNYGGSSTCTPCSVGTYSSMTGSSTCTLCSTGKYSSSTGSSTCTSCSAGKYSSSDGSS